MSDEHRVQGFASSRWRVTGQTLALLFAVSATDIISTDELSVWRVADGSSAWGWLTNGVFVCAIVALMVAGRDRAARRLTFVYLALVTLSVLVNVLLIVIEVADGNAADLGIALFWDTIIVWFATLLVFSLCYWLIDGGGPEARQDGAKGRSDLIFPQQGGEYPHWQNWQPGFPDYLFHSFSACASYAPGDVMVMSDRGG